MSTKIKTELFPVEDLRFDYANPRLAEFGIDETTPEDEILKLLWDVMDVMELVQSISASGFFPHEALIVAKENRKTLVIEGNRRLAALKLLIDPTIAVSHGWKIPEISKEAREDLKMVPVIVSKRKESWRYLGFKHVNGAAKWTSYAKAAYIAEVHRLYDVSLEDIANQIGDRHRTVQRLFRALMALEQAEKAKVFDREDRYHQRFSFSHLYTGLDSDGIGNFLEIGPKDVETSTPVQDDKITELGEILVWLYGSKAKKQPPVVQSQNPHLRQLNAVVKDREAIAALRAGANLAESFEISRPTESVFEEALLGAKRELTRARGHLTDGYDKSEELLRIAGTIADMASDIYDEMARKRSGRRNSTRMSEK